MTSLSVSKAAPPTTESTASTTTNTNTSAGAAYPSTSTHVTEWQDAQVSSWLASLNLANLAASFRDQGITGDVLVQLDNEALKELGVDSVGQRLALLGGIYRLKETWGLDIDQGDYRPQSEDVKAIQDPPVTVPQLIACLRQRDERILRLEQELRRTTVFLAKFQYDFTGICRYQGLRAPTTDYAFQPFVPASASSLARKTSAQNGLLSPSFTAVATTPTHGHPQPAASQQQQQQPQQQHSLASPGPSQKSSSGTQPPSHGTDTSFSGPQSAWSAASSYQNTLSRPSQPQPQPPLIAAPSTTTTAVAPIEEVAEDRIRTPASAQPLDPISPSFMAGATDDHHQNRAQPPDGPLTSPGGLSSTGSVSTPTSATYPPWIRGVGGVTSTPSSNGRSLTKAGHGQPISPPPSGGLPPPPTSSRAGGLASPGPQPTSSTSLRTQQSSNSSSGSNKERSSEGSSSRDFVGTATTLGTGDNSYKSFRVTLEDPCYKVLPAALKKYKINDDWRLYALFICYGSTERCLSYDEKPLLLFQKLKEARQNPVFMLRHIRDVKSPISIANAKAAARRGSAHSSGGGSSSASTGKTKEGSTATAASAAAKSSKVIRLTPGSGFAAAAAVGSTVTEALVTGPAAQLPNPEASRSYAIAIYPYVCEREDEFDVSVGDTFVVLSKAKGWWVVQCDARATGAGDAGGATEGDASERIEIRSGWVPAGCLIETSKPLASVHASAQSPVSAAFPRDDLTVEHTTIPIPPGIITSTSTPGVMLMDYTSDAHAHASTAAAAAAVADDAKDPSTTSRLELRKDDRLKVFKRYNHWSYCVQENGNHARGWVPSWYIGKVSSSRSASASGSGTAEGPASEPTSVSGTASTAPTSPGVNDAANAHAAAASSSSGTSSTTVVPSGLLSNSRSNDSLREAAMIPNIAGIE